MDSSDVSLLSTFSPLHLVRLASIPRKWNPVIRDQIKEQKIQNILAFNMPIEALVPDASVLGAFDVQQAVPNKLGEIFSKLLFTIAAAITIETPPYDAQGRTASNVEQTIRREAKQKGTLPANNNDFRLGSIMYELTYNAFEILRSEEGAVVGYRIWFFIADKSLYDVASRIVTLFELNIARKEELTSKKNIFKAMLASIENKKNNALTRPPGPGYRMAYENYYLDITRPRQWAKIIRMYSVMGLEDGDKKEGIAGDDDEDNDNSQEGNESYLSFLSNDMGESSNNNNNINNNFVEESERRLYKVLTSVSNKGDPNGLPQGGPGGMGGGDDKSHTTRFTRFNASTLNTRHVSKDWGENFVQESHPWNPINSLNKECAMTLWTSRVRESQKNIAEYFDISSSFPGSKDDAKLLNLKEMLALGIEDDKFSDFPFPKDVFVLERDYVVPSMLFIMLPPHILQEGSEFDKFLKIERKRDYLYSKKIEELTEKERIERGFYDLMVIKSLPAPEAEKVKDIDLRFVNKLKETFEDTVESLLNNFANTGKFNGREDPGDGSARVVAKDEDLDLEHNLDKDYFERHDIFLKLRKKNTMAYKYLDNKYDKRSNEYKVLKKMLEATNTWEFWRAFKHAKEVSPAIVKTRNWFFRLPPEQQWPNVSSRYTENLTLFGNFTLRHIIYISEIERCVTNARLARQLSKYRHNAFKYEDDRNHQRNNACIPGPGMGGKSFLLDMLANTCTPGCVHETSYISEQAYGISGVIDDEIVILHETSKEFLGAEGTNENKLRMLKERLEKEVVHTTTFDMGPSKEQGERRRKKTACSCQGLTVFASNVNITKADGPLLSRFMVHMVPVRKGMPVGYRVKDRQKTQETELNNKEIRDDERHQQVLIHTYVLFLEKMIKANVFGRQVFMGTTVETTNSIIEELQKKHKLDTTDIRLNSQIELVNRSTCVEYAIMATHFTPLSFKWSRNGEKINEYNPMIIPEIVLKFLYVTKEMIVHTLTLESEFWEKNLRNMVFKNISRLLLSVPSQVEFLRKSAATAGMDAVYDTDYVWITNHDKHQVYDELAKCMDDGFTAAEMEAIIESVKYKKVDLNVVKKYSDDFEQEYQKSCNNKMIENDPEDVEEDKNKNLEEPSANAELIVDESAQDVDMNDGFGDIVIDEDVEDIINDMNDAEDIDDITSIKSKDEFMDDSTELAKTVKERHNAAIRNKKEEEKKKEEEGSKKKKSKKQKGKSSSSSSIIVKINEPTRKNLKFVRSGFHEGEYYVAFHIGELKRIEHEFGTSTTNPVIDAVKTVLGTDNYERYPEEIMDVLLEDYGVTENDLINTELITGLDGNHIVVPIEIKDTEHELIVPVSKYSPTISIKRGPKRMVVHNYNSIPEPAQMMLFENKRMQNLVSGFQEHTGRMYGYDMDFENYVQNCELNGDDPFDELSLIALPAFTKRVVKSAVDHFYPKMAKTADLHYPKDFFEAETKKVVNIYLYNNIATNDNVTQIVKRVENPEIMKTFGFDENGNYVQLKVKDGWGSITSALGLPSGVATRAAPIKKMHLVNLIRQNGLGQSFIAKDSLIDNTLNNTDVGQYYTMDLLFQGEEEPFGKDPSSETTSSSAIAKEDSNQTILNNTNVRVNSETFSTAILDEGSNAGYFSSDSNMSQNNNNSNMGRPKKRASLRMDKANAFLFSNCKPQRTVSVSIPLPKQDLDQVIDESSQKSQMSTKKRKLASLYDGDSDDEIADGGDLTRNFFKKAKK